MKELVVNSPIPLYYQLREIIRDRIVSGEWGDGTEIPSEIKFCQDYNLSRATVRQALDGLVNEGLIIRKRGIGTFVVYDKVASNFLIEPSFSVNTDKKSMNDYAKLLYADFVKADSFIKGYLQTEIAYHIKRIHYINKIPVSLDSHYIKEEYANTLLDMDIEKIAINKWLENTLGIEIERYQTHIQAIKLNKYENEIFKFPSLNFGLMMENLAFFNDEPIIFNRRILRGDRCDINLELILSNNKYELKNSTVDFTENPSAERRKEEL